MRARMHSSLVVVVAAFAVSAFALSTASLAQERGSLTPAQLEEQVQKSEWTSASWRADLDAAAELARATHPSAAERLLRLEGLQPERYLARRRAEPEVARELTRLVRQDVVPAALVAELLMGGSGRYPFSSQDRFGKKSPADVEKLMRMEREQLTSGLLLALGDSRHESAFFVTRAVLLDDKRPAAERRVAAVALGKTRDARAVTTLAAVTNDEKGSAELRTAAIAGLGHVRSLAAVTSLGELSRTTTDVTMQRAAALALGNNASVWTLGGVDRGVAERMRVEASTALVDLLERTGEPQVASAVIDALGMVAHESAKTRLSAIAADGRRPDALRERATRAERRLDRALSRR